MDYSNDNDLIEGIRDREDAAYAFIRQQYYEGIRQMVISESGSEDDAKDIFNDSLVSFSEAMDDPDKVMDYQLNTFFYGICKKKWLKKLRERRQYERYLRINGSKHSHDETEENLDKKLFKNIIWKSFEKLKEDCRKIVKAYLQDVSNKEIAKSMGFTPAYVKKKKHYCLEELKVLVKRDPGYLRSMPLEKYL